MSYIKLYSPNYSHMKQQLALMQTNTGKQVRVDLQERTTTFGSSFVVFFKVFLSTLSNRRGGENLLTRAARGWRGAAATAKAARLAPISEHG